MSGPKILALIGCGLVVWAIAAGFIHFAGPIGAFVGDAKTLALYAVTPVIMFAAVVTICAVLHIDGASRLTAAVIMSTTALLLDGVAMRWFGDLYGAGDAILGGAAWLHWAVGCTLLTALVIRKTITL